MEVFDENSTELIAELRQQKRDELNAQNYPENSNHAATYKQTTNYLINLVQREYLINDEEINELVYSINDRLTACNPSIKPIKKILIKRDGFLNASSYGEGTISLNIGLIAAVESEEELAFIVAHEIAHYHLDHLRSRIEKFTNRASSKTVMRRINKIPEGNMTLEDLQFVQAWFNNMLLNSRESELQADSLALVMFRNCEYSNEFGLDALTRLKSVYHPPNPLKRNLFDEFIFDEYPFKKRWLNTKRVKRSGSLLTHLLNNDSIETHPDIDIRIERIANKKSTAPASESTISQSISKRSQLELISSFYKNGLYDFGIHTALQLKAATTSTSEIDFYISRMLYEITLAINDNRLPVYVRNSTFQYPPETRALNNFFYNLTVAEASEISYLYTKKNFDPENPNHYRVLFKTHELTNRLSQNKSLKREFKKRFPKENIAKYPEKD